jgi:hypothetical protein
MPPIVIPSPRVLDQTFPKSKFELRLAAASLGELVKSARNGHLRVGLTDAIRELTRGENYDWSTSTNRLRLDILNQFAQLFLVATDSVTLDSTHHGAYTAHPTPCGLPSTDGLAGIWADEVGELRSRHDRVTGTRRPGCLAIACDEAWAGTQDRSCANEPNDPPPLPTVGPAEVDGLSDAFTRSAPKSPAGTKVSVAAAKRHVHLLGGDVQEQDDGSHIPVKFDRSRTWALDTNNDPVPDTYLDELRPITGMPLAEIKTVLVRGTRPVEVCVLDTGRT